MKGEGQGGRSAWRERPHRTSSLRNRPSQAEAPSTTQRGRYAPGPALLPLSRRCRHLGTEGRIPPRLWGLRKASLS